MTRVNARHVSQADNLDYLFGVLSYVVVRRLFKRGWMTNLNVMKFNRKNCTYKYDIRGEKINVKIETI